MHSNKVCVLGGSGFVGSHLVAALSNAGKQVTVISRHRERCRHLLVLPGVRVVQLDLYQPNILNRTFQGMGAVINLVGVLNGRGRGNESFRAAHVELTKLVVRACIEANVPRLLHMSALCADAGRGTSHYLRSKGEAENHAHTFSRGKLGVTTFRPSVIFGAGDGLFCRFAQLLRITPILPLACPNSRFAPVFIGDVVKAFTSALDNPSCIGQHQDLVGPEIYTLKQLVEYTAELIGKRHYILGLPLWLSKVQAAIFEHLPGKLFTLDNYASLQMDSINEKVKPQPTSIRAVIPKYLGKQALAAQYQTFRETAGRA